MATQRARRVASLTRPAPRFARPSPSSIVHRASSVVHRHLSFLLVQFSSPWTRLVAPRMETYLRRVNTSRSAAASNWAR